MVKKLPQIKMNFSDTTVSDPCSVNFKEISRHDVAIIGISLKFPLANSPEMFWNNLREGKDCIRTIPERRRQDADAYLKYTNSPFADKGYAEGGYLEDIDKFDSSFFNIPPAEAKLMDPGQRMFFETAWKAFEDAGYSGDEVKGTNTGTFVGYGGSSEYQQMVERITPDSSSVAFIGNLQPIIASRIAHFLDLRGPSMLINTTCSSSSVAIHYACESIRRGECDMALAGAATAYYVPIRKAHIGQEASDDRTKTFDDSSDGTGAGEGVSAILLKPLYKAVQDRNHIYAVIKGNAINHNGRGSGLITPCAKAQEEVIVKAWKNANIDPRTISYVEAHGSGTKLGDPIEIDGIQRAFSHYTKKKHFCGIGSVKTNIGHLDETAGVAAVIKCALALKYGQLPPSLHFNRPNRNIRFENSPVYVVKRLTSWDTGDIPRRCGVNATGLNGTNCHLILEEAPDLKGTEKRTSGKSSILTLSAKTKDSLKELVRNYKEFFMGEMDAPLEDICYTSSTGRGHYAYKIAMVATNLEDLTLKMSKLDPEYLDTTRLYGFYYGEPVGKSSMKQKRGSGSVLQDSVQKLEKIIELEEGIERMELLHELSMAYVDGADIDWRMLYGNDVYYKVSLPTYCFEKTRYWLDIPLEAEPTMPKGSYTELGFAREDSNLFYSTEWQTQPLDIDKVPISGSLLVFTNTEEARQFVRKLREQQHHDVIEVQIGPVYEKLNDQSFTSSVSIEDMTRLAMELKNRNIKKIIHMITMSNQASETIKHLDQSLHQGVLSLFRMTKHLFSVIEHKFEVILVTEHAHQVTGREPEIYPENASFLGLGRVIAHEYPHCVIRAIDMDNQISMEQLTQEIYAREAPYAIAYREGQRFTEQFVELDVQKAEERSFELSSDGVYVVTGGLGKKGLAIGKYMASIHPIRIAFIDPLDIPERIEWDQRAKTRDELAQKLNVIMDIEETGATVDIYQADVTDYEKMESIFNSLRDKYGKINGIIHNASVGGEGFILRKLEDDFQRVLGPKIHGTWILDKLTQADDLDFFILFASAIALTGARGMGEYTSSNSYIDAFRAHRQKKNPQTFTVFWTSWGHASSGKEHEMIREIDLFEMLPTSHLLDAFHQVMNKRLDKVIIGQLRRDRSILEKNILRYGPTLSESMLRRINGAPSDKGTAATKLASSNEPMVGHQISNRERMFTLALHAWKEALGFEEIETDANFFDIGGNSILITRVWEQLDKAFPGKITVADLFKYQTLTDLSEYLQSFSDSLEEDNQNEIEEVLFEIWRKVLGYSDIDPNANFFEIGGNSIQLMNVHLMIEQRLPGTVITDLFKYPTISELAACIRKKKIEVDNEIEAKDENDDIHQMLDALEKGELALGEAMKMWNK